MDLSAIDGLGASTLGVLMSEVGTGSQLRAAFPSAHAFASWLGLCPDNRVSGGKVLRAKTRKVQSRLAGALRLAAQALRNSHSRLGDYSRRLKGRLGKAEGITATARKLARIIYGMIASRQPYDENEAFKITPATHTRRVRHLHKQAETLGCQLVPITPLAI